MSMPWKKGRKRFFRPFFDPHGRSGWRVELRMRPRSRRRGLVIDCPLLDGKLEKRTDSSGDLLDLLPGVGFRIVHYLHGCSRAVVDSPAIFLVEPDDLLDPLYLA